MPSFALLRDLLLAAVLVGWVSLAVAAGIDARRRWDARGAAWLALLVGLALPYVGLLLYGAVRPRETNDVRLQRRVTERYLVTVTGGLPAARGPAEREATAAPMLVEQPAL